MQQQYTLKFSRDEADLDMPCDVHYHRLELTTLSGLAQADEGKLPVLLVDGYNVLNARWKLLGIAEACPMNLEDEREQLINDTRDYALSLSCRSIVVFDAMASRHTLGTPRRVLHSLIGLATALKVASCVKGRRQLVSGKLDLPHAVLKRHGTEMCSLLQQLYMPGLCLSGQIDGRRLTVEFSRLLKSVASSSSEGGSMLRIEEPLCREMTASDILELWKRQQPFN